MKSRKYWDSIKRAAKSIKRDDPQYASERNIKLYKKADYISKKYKENNKDTVNNILKEYKR